MAKFHEMTRLLFSYWISEVDNPYYRESKQMSAPKPHDYYYICEEEIDGVLALIKRGGSQLVQCLSKEETLGEYEIWCKFQQNGDFANNNMLYSLFHSGDNDNVKDIFMIYLRSYLRDNTIDNLLE